MALVEDCNISLVRFESRSFISVKALMPLPFLVDIGGISSLCSSFGLRSDAPGLDQSIFACCEDCTALMMA